MLTLMLLRHAKAVQHSRDDDFSRELQEKGACDAARLGACLASRNIVPDLACVSSSTRTRQTFEGLCEALKAPLPVTFDDMLYNATAGELRVLLPATAPGVCTLLIVGHNPGIADLAAMLARDGDLVDLERLRNRFAPCSLAVLGFDVDDWAEAAARGGRLDLFLAPEDF